MIRQAKRLMAPDALLVLAVPPFDWLRRWLGTIPIIRNNVSHPQINVFNEVDEHVNMLGRQGVRRLASATGLNILPVRYHHSRSEEHTSELQSLMRISYAVFCLQKKKHTQQKITI